MQEDTSPVIKVLINHPYLVLQANFQQRTKILSKWVRELSSKHMGIRFLQWKSSPRKEIQEDVIQNLMMLVNGILAIQVKNSKGFIR